MAKICPLFSGSSGNCTYIAHKGVNLLIDAGMPYKSIAQALESIGADIEKIDAVAVTHEHSDHIKGLNTLIKRTGAKLIASKETYNTLVSNKYISADIPLFELKDSKADLGEIEVVRFATSHDCEGSSGYSLNLSNGQKISVCTDTGIVTKEIETALSGSDAVLMESNHDVDMLNRGPYPPALKLRILSDKGHLSNVSCAVQLTKLLNSGTTRFILGHLSKNNNMPALALSCSKAALLDIGARRDIDYILSVAKPENNGVTAI